MRVLRQLVILDAADLGAESMFWAGVLGGEVIAEDDWHTVVVDGKQSVAIQLAPDDVPPDWPLGAPQQIHLDLFVDDIEPAHEAAINLGTRLLQAADNLTAAEGFQVYADPAGHPFCLCWEG